MNKERLTDLLTNCLSAIDEQYMEFEFKVGILRTMGIQDDELKELGFEYMIAYMEDCKDE